MEIATPIRPFVAARAEYPEIWQTVLVDDCQIALTIAKSDIGFSGGEIERDIESLVCFRFREKGLEPPKIKQPGEKERLLRQAKELRELAARGMKPRAYKKKAEELELKASKL